MEQLRAGAQILVQQKSPLGESLNSLFTGVEEYALNTDQGLAQGRKNVETWYDSTMDQLNGSYKRWAQWWAFGIGLIIAFAFNVDSIFIAQELWHTPATRIATAAYVQQFTEKKGTNLTTTDIQDMNLALQALHFPVGWKIDDRPRDLWWGVLKFFGCLITALAAMQGAPFWFDTLKKIVNVRSAGVNPVEKPKESASAA